jgi:hypothetical protein
VTHPAVANRVPQGQGHMLLPEHFVEALRAETAV